MSEENRPDADALLARVEAEEAQKAKGKLKIFLGYAAGVGKTFSMLEAAHSRNAEGVDVVVGLVETHGRAETETLLQGLEVIPRKIIEYRGVQLSEMDLDAVLTRKPQLALVDEHAHTNAPGSRHSKRWQDVEELINAGIDVYTTLNIQHLESFRDIVAQITGVAQKETVPDRVIDEAADIEVVDLPPEELLQRLREGKVYIPEQAVRAMQQFFESGNLIALREITLRRAASRVDEEMREYLKSYATPELWPVTERLLVCISGSPNSERLIRSARRLAEDLKTEWYALYVETAEDDRLTQENRERIWRELRLAESLGAKEVVTLRSDYAPDAVIDYARKHKITKVIAGRSSRTRWTEGLRSSFVDKILRRSKDIDIYVVKGSETSPQEEPPRWQHSKESWRSYFICILLVAGTTGVNKIASAFLSPTNIVIFYLLAVVLAALRLGFKQALLTAFLGVLAFDFFFVPPYWSLAVEDTEYLVTFAGLFIVGAVISKLVSRVRSQAEAVKSREAQTSSLYALSRDLAGAVNLDDIFLAAVNRTAESMNAQIAILLPQGESLNVQAGSSGLSLGEKERSVALWTFHNGQLAGRGTETLSSSSLLYVPLLSRGNVHGVMGIKMNQPEDTLSPSQQRLVEAYASQTAQAIERVHLAKRAEKSQLLEATERLERSLLNSISHDLRTPLSSISGALSSLRYEGSQLDGESKREMIELAWEEAGRMNRFITNLLDITRLEAGVLKIKREPYDFQDLLGSCTVSLEPRLKGRKIHIHLPPNLPLIPMDSVLMFQVLINLLDNALKYSPPDGVIEVSAQVRDNGLEVGVTDEGPGIPEEYLVQVFNKFFRLNRSEEVSGTGLGLAISKGIIEAHEGKIRAENRPGGGSKIIFTLPFKISGVEGKF